MRVTFSDFTKRQIMGLLEKAVIDKKLPDTLLFHFEATRSWPFTEEQERILLSYATKDQLTKSARESVENLRVMERFPNENISNTSPIVDNSGGDQIVINQKPFAPLPKTVYVDKVVYKDRFIDDPSRKTREEWRRVEEREVAEAAGRLPKVRRVIRDVK